MATKKQLVKIAELNMMKPSEILVKSLELWGPEGEHWCTGSLVKSTNYAGERSRSYCLYGGVSKVACGTVGYYDSLEKHEQHPTFTKAMVYIHKRIPTPNYGIIHFNDAIAGGDFTKVKAVVCAALKDALADEQQQDEVQSE